MNESDPPLSEAAQPKSKYTCRICGQPADAELPTFPFCSARCRQVDLGRWATGKYVVSRELTPDDLEEERK